jgi:hypothetical protein
MLVPTASPSPKTSPSRSSAYDVGVGHLPDGQSATQFTRDQLDRLEIGQDLTEIPHGTKRPKLPKSKLAQDQTPANEKTTEATG